ncbi:MULTISPECIES: DUF1206 domain-containing protein [unclassified Microcella]|uniref:DUF1206 domain-containing protein n=1 Tax=unclassified Microcella TaxID=2630066 RepID=UPI0006FC00D3|nr:MULTISPECIES: DUF1206 domain-containing protein [unclassified Microcella]KQV25080.1 hypothetical protein ASC54_11510 [Yonghaparkia sp. Root332]KRF31365.1 hypothetical protein ASG83_11315 [Yonghaparkia sp. Soil809]
MNGSATVQNVHGSRIFTLLARSGWVVTGLLHVIIGALAIAVAFGDRRVLPDEVGAFETIAAAPLGDVLLVAVIVSLVGLGVWMIADAFLNRGPMHRWTSGLASAAQGLVYLALAIPPGVLLFGGDLMSGRSARALSAALLDSTTGAVVLILIGAGIAIGGGYFVVKGVRRRFSWELRPMSRRRGRAVRALGAVGYVARGIAFLLLAGLIIVEAIEVDPTDVTGLAGALGALRRGFLGPFWLASIGAGLIIYGVYSIARARLATI